MLRRCYQGWPFFRTLIDDIEAMLARADPAVAAHYERLASPELRVYGVTVRAEYERTCALVLEIKQCSALLDSDQTLQRSIALRKPVCRPDEFHAGRSARALARQRTAASRAVRGAAGQRQRHRARLADHGLNALYCRLCAKSGLI